MDSNYPETVILFEHLNNCSNGQMFTKEDTLIGTGEWEMENGVGWSSGRSGSEWGESGSGCESGCESECECGCESENRSDMIKIEVKK